MPSLLQRFVMLVGCLALLVSVAPSVEARCAPPSPSGDPLFTPQRDGAGRIMNWNTLALHTWHQVAGTNMNQVEPLLQAAGYIDYGVERFAGVTNDWGGGAADMQAGLHWILGGGHAGTNNNGIYELNWNTMQWRIAVMPSIINAEQKADLDRLVGGNWSGSLSWGYGPYGDLYPDVGTGLGPGTKFPAIHVWHKADYMPDKGTFLVWAIQRMWVVDGRRGTETPLAPLASNANDAVMVYDLQRQQFHVWSERSYSDYWGVSTHDATTGALLNYRGSNPPPLDGSYHFSQLATMNLVGRELFFMNAYTNAKAPRAWFINVDTWKGHPLTVTPFPPVSIGAPRTLSAPELGQVVYHLPDNCGNVWRIDLTTGQAVHLSGPFTAKAANGLYGKAQYWPAQKLIIVVPNVGENVRVIRMAD